MQKCVPAPLRRIAKDLRNGKTARKGFNFATAFPQKQLPAPTAPSTPNPLEKFFDAKTQGHGIWKWRHYFDLYHRHLHKFVAQDVALVEIGVYSGGSLEMWRSYFGPQCRVHGVDIEPACKAYDNGHDVRIFIGDQADRAFWADFRAQVPTLDIVIDDGGHTPHQQIVTLEETLPHLRPGGVFICEDVHGINNQFAHYVSGLSHQLHGGEVSWSLEDPERRLATRPTPFQSAIHSIHLYPYAVVLETSPTPVTELRAPKHGTVWQPFLK